MPSKSSVIIFEIFIQISAGSFESDVGLRSVRMPFLGHFSNKSRPAWCSICFGLIFAISSAAFCALSSILQFFRCAFFLAAIYSNSSLSNFLSQTFSQAGRPNNCRSAAARPYFSWAVANVIWGALLAFLALILRFNNFAVAFNFASLSGNWAVLVMLFKLPRSCNNSQSEKLIHQQFCWQYIWLRSSAFLLPSPAPWHNRSNYTAGNGKGNASTLKGLKALVVSEHAARAALYLKDH